LKNSDWSQFQNDLLQSELFCYPATSADDFADQLDIVALSVWDKHCPLQLHRQLVFSSRENRWLSAAARIAKRQRRKLERLWRATRLADDNITHHKQCRVTNKIIVESRGAFYNERIEASAADPRRRWTAIRSIPHMTEIREVRSVDDNIRLSEGFCTFFVEKIQRIKDSIKQKIDNSLDDPLRSNTEHFDPYMLTDLRPPTADEVLSSFEQCQPSRRYLIHLNHALRQFFIVKRFYPNVM
jgi:hypothetical protein